MRRLILLPRGTSSVHKFSSFTYHFWNLIVHTLLYGNSRVRFVTFCQALNKSLRIFWIIFTIFISTQSNENIQFFSGYNLNSKVQVFQIANKSYNKRMKSILLMCMIGGIVGKLRVQRDRNCYFKRIQPNTVNRKLDQRE
jgi:hypothetical protein